MMGCCSKRRLRGMCLLWDPVESGKRKHFSNQFCATISKKASYNSINKAVFMPKGVSDIVPSLFLVLFNNPQLMNIFIKDFFCKCDLTLS